MYARHQGAACRNGTRTLSANQLQMGRFLGRYSWNLRAIFSAQIAHQYDPAQPLCLLFSGRLTGRIRTFIGILSPEGVIIAPRTTCTASVLLFITQVLTRNAECHFYTDTASHFGQNNALKRNVSGDKMANTPLIVRRSKVALGSKKKGHPKVPRRVSLIRLFVDTARYFSACGLILVPTRSQTPRRCLF